MEEHGVVAGALLTARLALAAVFTLAAGAKLVDRARLRIALADFGVPKRLSPPVAALLPVAELGVAAAVVLPPSARTAAGAALALLMAFSAAIATSLWRGRTFDCHCFGQLHPSPIGAASLVRNVLLGALSAFVLWLGPGMGLGSVVAQVGGLLSPLATAGLVAVAILSAIATVQAWFLLQLLGQQGRLLLRVELLESPLGAEDPSRNQRLAADFTLESVSGGSVSLTDLLVDDRPALLVFTSSGCSPCTGLLPEVARWQREYGEVLTVAVLARGDQAANTANAARYGVARLLVDATAATASEYRALPTPSGVLIAPDGRIGSGIAIGSDQIRGLLVRAVDRRDGLAPRPYVRRSSREAGAPSSRVGREAQLHVHGG